MNMQRTGYDRCRRAEHFEQLLERTAQRPFGKDEYHWSRHASRVRRLEARLLLVIWGLPNGLQTGLCWALAQRTLPAFEQRHPSLRSMRDFLNPDWLRRTMACVDVSPRARWEALGYELNALRQSLGEHSPKGGDEHLYGAACGLWDALEPDASEAKTSAACVYSVACAVKAEQYEAWELLDPEAANYVRDTLAIARREGHVLLPKVATSYRIPEADPTAQAHWIAGWAAALAWLRSAHLETHKDVKDRCALAQAIRKLRSHGWALAGGFPKQ